MIRRIAMISVHSCPLAVLGGKETGGMNVYVREISKELGRQGIGVDIFTRAKHPALAPEVHLSPQVRLIHLAAGPQRPYRKELLWDHLQEFCAGILQANQRCHRPYDLIHSHYWLSGWVAVLLKRVWGVPILHMSHTLGLGKNRATRQGPPPESEHRITVERVVMNLSTALVASTPADKAQMTCHYGIDPDKIRVIPCGVDLGRFTPKPSGTAKDRLGVHGRQVILFVGRIEPLKGIDILIRAAARLADDPELRREQLLLLIVGGEVDHTQPSREDQELQRLRRLAAELGVADLVRFLGSRRQEELPHYYGAAEVCVLPSYYESFGLVALEAMACGRPVIASRVGGLPHLVRDGVSGFLVPEGDPHSLAQRLKLLLTDAGRREEMGQEGIKVAQRFTWPAITQQLIALYQQLLGTNGYKRKGVREEYEGACRG